MSRLREIKANMAKAKGVILNQPTEQVVEMRIVDIGGVMVLVLEGITVLQLEGNPQVYEEVKRMARVLVRHALAINFMDHTEEKFDDTKPNV